MISYTIIVYSSVGQVVPPKERRRRSVMRGAVDSAQAEVDRRLSEKGEVLLWCGFPPKASVQWQLDGLTIHTNKWFLGAGFLGTPPFSLRLHDLAAGLAAQRATANRLRRDLGASQQEAESRGRKAEQNNQYNE